MGVTELEESSELSERPTAVAGPVDDEEDGAPYLCYTIVALITIFVVLLLAIKSLRTDIFTGLESAGDTIQNAKGWGVLLYLLLYLFWGLACGPSTIPEGMAGFIFPFGWAVVLATCGRGCSTFAMCIVGRRFAAEYIHRHFVEKYKWVQALVKLYETQPYKAAALISFAEMPFSFKNYPYSITQVTRPTPHLQTNA